MYIWLRLVENVRAFRAVMAVCLAAALALTLFAHDRSGSRQRDAAFRSANAGLWMMSELLFESQRLSTTLAQHLSGQTDLDEVTTRFDVLWSRMGVLKHGLPEEATSLHTLLDDFQTHLAENEDLIFAGAKTPVEVDAMRLFDEKAQKHTLGLRRLWVHTLGNEESAANFLPFREVASGFGYYEEASFLLIMLLLVYVLAEIVMAGHAQKREERLKQEAYAANESKSRFLANVSHEIRTPLNGILGMTAELATSHLDEDQTHCLRVIEDSGGVLLSTINDVLDLSRIEAGEMHMEERPFDIRHVLEAACALYAARAREKDLMVELRIDADLPTALMGDGRRLRQVLHNLIANAVKFTDNGAIIVHAREEAPARLQISVTDTGPGIPVSAQSAVFAPFTQADGSVTRRHGGTGLGLTISQQICNAMGGALSLRSAPGEGAVFTVDVPLVVAPDQAACSPEVIKSDATPDLGGMAILVVDDSATNRLVLERFLKGANARLSFAASGEEAVRKARDDAFDVILMDIQMPGLDGLAATRIIRERESEQPPGAQRTRILAVTANAMTHQAQEYRRAGLDDVLAKPVSKRILFATLQSQWSREVA